MKILVLLGSSRKNGNTEALMERVLTGIPSTVVHLMDKKILPIVDGRHTEEGFLPVDDEYNSLIRTVLEHDVVLFATPLYWYGMSGHMKNFVDRWSESLRDASLSFKQEMAKKKAFVVVCGGDEARVKGLPLIDQFRYIFDFMGMEFVDFVIAEGNKPGDVLADTSGLLRADELHTTIKELIQQS